jgi:hypothetical protein
MDVANPEKIAALRKLCKKRRLDLYEISAVTGKGIPELKYALGKRVAKIRTGTYAQEHPAPAKKVGSSRKNKKRAESVKRVSKQAAFKKRQTR